MAGTKYITDVRKLPHLHAQEKADLAEIQRYFRFKAPQYYLDLIDWDDPNDPLRRIVVPHADEMIQWGRSDPSNETSVTKAPGVQHKYPHTALLLVSDTCAGLCRFCFRKRIFRRNNPELLRDVEAGLQYIREHPAITDVLLTGGDPLALSTRRLTGIVEQLRRIKHVRIVRIGSKTPAYDPYRISEDDELIALFERFSGPGHRMYLMCHFNHPRELTGAAHEAVERVMKAGVVLCNQTPIIRGVNDDPVVLAELMNELASSGITPYYIFQCRPTRGNMAYTLPIVQNYFIIEEAKRHVDGLAKRLRFVMSHERGKIEIVGVTPAHIYLKYHRAKDPAREGKFLVFRRDDEAYWYDDLLVQERRTGVVHTGALRPLPPEGGRAIAHLDEVVNERTAHSSDMLQLPSDN
jgi:lysine 2,3-aminomutase